MKRIAIAVENRLRLLGVWPVVERTAALYGVHPHAVVGARRHREVVDARQHVLAVVRWSTGWSYPRLGRLFDLDHTSVMDAVRRHEEKLNP